MSKIFWDTNLFIYLFEAHAEFGEATADLRRRMNERGDHLITSSLTLGEVQVKARRMDQLSEALRFRDAIKAVSTIVSFDSNCADAYAMVREKTEVKGADAIQLACASAIGVEVFVTNDKRLQGISLPGIHFITSIDRVPF